MDHQTESSSLIQEIIRMSSNVPVRQYQAWSAQRGGEFKAECVSARKVAAKRGVSDNELRSCIGRLAQFWH